MKYLLISNDGIPLQYLTPVEGFALEDCFHADMLGMCAIVEDGFSWNENTRYDRAAHMFYELSPAPGLPSETPATIL